MRYLGPEGLAALKDLIKKALDGKANKTHTHEKSEIGDYVDYELPVASGDTLGGVKIGEGLEIDEDGVLNTAIKELEWDKVQNKPTKVSEFENDVGYINGIPENYVTKEYLESLELVSEIPEEYITEKELAEKGFLTEVPSFYVTEYELEAKKYLTNYTESDPVFQGSPSYKITEKDIENWNKIANEYNIPTKVSELENDREFIAKTDKTSFLQGKLYVYDRYDEWGNEIDLATGRIQGVNWGGSADTLYLNQNSSEDVEILSNGKGKLYYKRKEVATQEYVDKQISNIEIPETGENYELPIASADTLGGVKIGSNLSIDEDGTLNVIVENVDVDLSEYAKTADLHEHTNKDILDTISQDDINKWNSGTGDGSTMVDTVPIGTVILYDGEEIPDGYEEVENYVPTYSTEEQVIGTWIDGLPIYRKVIVTTTPSTANSWIDVDIGVDNIKEYIRYDAKFETSGLTYFADIFEDSTHKFMAVAKSNAIAILVGSAGWCSKPVTLILEYTKTTD